MLRPIPMGMIRSRIRGRRTPKFALDIQRGGCCMKFVTVGRFVTNANLIMSVEVYRPGNGCEVKVTGLDHPIKLSDQETEILLSLITPIGGMPAPL